MGDEHKRALREVLLARDGDTCAFCGQPGGDDDQTKLTIDRIIPGSEGGTYVPENCRLLCRYCNCSRGDKSDKHVRWASGVFQSGFTIVPNAILLREDLSPDVKTLWALLAHYAREDDACWPGQERLARQVGISERKLRDCVRDLQNIGLVRVRQRGRGRTNVYTLLDPRNGQDRQAVPPGPANGAALDRQTVPVPSDREAVEGNGEEGSPAGTSPAAGDQLFEAPAEAAAADPLDARAEEIWTHYASVFGDRLRVKELTPPRRRTLRKALSAVAGDVQLCKRAIDGLQSYRKKNPQGSQDVSLSVVFETGPHSRSSLTDQIEWWAQQADARTTGAGLKVPLDLSGVPSVSAGTIRVRREWARRKFEEPDNEYVQQQGEAALTWLREHCGHAPVFIDGKITGWQAVEA